MSQLETRRIPEDRPDVTAPDGSEIRLVSVSLSGGSMVNCRLEPGGVTHAVYHRTVEEMWYCVRGQGRLWRRLGEAAETVELTAGVGVSIPLGASFQFRNDGDETLEIIIATVPPWPGEQEAVRCDGPWTPSV
ncbi:MAG: cupin domain-containing protein [Chloroflexota bacterium]